MVVHMEADPFLLFHCGEPAPPRTYSPDPGSSLNQMCYQSKNQTSGKQLITSTSQTVKV